MTNQQSSSIYNLFGSDVEKFTDVNFDEKGSIKSPKTPIHIVLFYAPWCGHCKSAAHEYKKFANEIKLGGHSDDVTVVAVDCTQNPGFMARQDNFPYRVEAYPTIMEFRQDEPPEKYRGERTAESFLDAFVNY